MQVEGAEIWDLARAHTVRELPQQHVVRELVTTLADHDPERRDLLRRKLWRTQSDMGVRLFLLAFATAALGLERRSPAADSAGRNPRG